jgi:hypothetical protein
MVQYEPNINKGRRSTYGCGILKQAVPFRHTNLKKREEKRG